MSADKPPSEIEQLVRDAITSGLRYGFVAGCLVSSAAWLIVLIRSSHGF